MGKRFFKTPRTLISTDLRWMFIRTCNPRISVRGPNTCSQSFFSGVIRCGGMGIRLVSDFKVDFSAPGATGAKEGASVVGGANCVGSVSIMSSSSS